ncbi:Protein of unknown function [Marinospirillum celere]|uniref:DUF3750 domain-containing protein n=2 Tax=Marinospirillum celere TaxID=1122252 RepID=A0A1I1EZN3_9GAMM|nr:Protein of unknown function [Marinospirillum celere]
MPLFASIKWFLRSLLVVTVFLLGPLLMVACAGSQNTSHWSQASRDSSGVAPKPEEVEEALVQVYAARVFGWRGNFAVHTWIATKEEGADTWYVHEVMGWHSTPVRSLPDLPDRFWYGAQPELLAELRGDQAAAAIPHILDAVQTYPYPDRYEAWPGPNSNTFVAWLIRETPQLRVVLPNTAIGKDYPATAGFNRSPRATGFQASLFGYLGVTAGIHEGLEVNLLGLNLGIDPWHLGVKLPGIGQLSMRDPWAIPEPSPLAPTEAAAHLAD